MFLRYLLGIAAIVLLLHVASAGLTRTPSYAFWTASRSFSQGLVWYSENVLINLEAFRDRSIASLDAYRERLDVDPRRSFEDDKVLIKMIATHAFAKSCLEIATVQSNIYSGFLNQTFVFGSLLTPMPEPDSKLSLRRERE